MAYIMTPIEIITLFHLSVIFLVICISISAFEIIKSKQVFDKGGLLDWRINKLYYPRIANILNKYQFKIVSLQIVKIIFSTIIFLQVLLMEKPLYLTTCLSIIFITHLLQNFRIPFGRDGSDQMITVVLFGLILMSWNHNTLIFQLGVMFISVQCILCYTTSGWSKWVSPIWRNQPVLIDILDTKSYGFQTVAKWLNNNKILCRAVALFVMTFQASFPLIIFMPPEGIYLYLTIGALFHLSIAIVMGLNTFFWSFIACYPILLIGLDLLHKTYPWLQITL